MSRLFLKQTAASLASGAKILSPDHNNEQLPADGDWVIDSVYWQRRILDGDVAEVKPPKVKDSEQ